MKSSMLDHLFVKRTGQVKQSYQPISASLNITKEDNHSTEFSTLDEYQLQLLLKARFFCSSEEFDMALDNSEKLLLRELFKPILNISLELKKAAYEQNYKEIMNLANELEKECGF